MNDFNAVIEGMNFHNIGGKGFPDSIVVSNGGNIANGEYTDIIYTPDKHAHWNGDDGKIVSVIDGIPQRECCCSNCGAWLVGSDEHIVNGVYCPKCGARMDEVMK